MLTRMLPGDPHDDPDEPDDDHHDVDEHDDDDVGEPPLSRWSTRMPTSVAGLAAGAVVCLVVIALCVAALAGALGFLVRG